MDGNRGDEDQSITAPTPPQGEKSRPPPGEVDRRQDDRRPDGQTTPTPTPPQGEVGRRGR